MSETVYRGSSGSSAGTRIPAAVTSRSASISLTGSSVVAIARRACEQRPPDDRGGTDDRQRIRRQAYETALPGSLGGWRAGRWDPTRYRQQAPPHRTAARPTAPGVRRRPAPASAASPMRRRQQLVGELGATEAIEIRHVPPARRGPSSARSGMTGWRRCRSSVRYVATSTQPLGRAGCVTRNRIMIPRRPVGPMQVLQDDHQRPIGGAPGPGRRSPRRTAGPGGQSGSVCPRPADRIGRSSWRSAQEPLRAIGVRPTMRTRSPSAPDRGCRGDALGAPRRTGRTADLPHRGRGTRR